MMEKTQLGQDKNDLQGIRPEEKKYLDRKAQELLEEKEAESRMRTYLGPMSKILTALLCLWTVFQLYFTTIGAVSAINLRAFHCIFLLLFTFLLFIYG